MRANTIAQSVNRQETLYNLIFFFAIAGSLITFGYRVLLCSYPIPNTGGAEGNVVYFIQRVVAGENLYSNPSEPVYAVAQYSPLYYLLVGQIAKWLGIGPGQVPDLFTLNRAVTLTLHVGLCAIIALYCKRTFRFSLRKAVTTGLLIFMFLMPLSRPDSLSMLFWFAGFFFFLDSISMDEKSISWKPFFSALFCSLALFSKQSSITLLVIVIAWFLLKKQFKPAIAYLLTAAVCCFIFFLPFAAHSHNFFDNVISGIDNGVDFSNYWSAFVGFYYTNGFLFVVTMVFTCLFLWKENSLHSQFLLCAIAIQFGLSNLFGIKAGSGTNYLMECIVLTILAVCIYAEKIDQLFSQIHLYAGGLLLLTIIVLKGSSYVNLLLWQKNKTIRESIRKEYLEQDQAARYIQSKEGNTHYFIVTDLETREFYLSNLLPNKLLFPQSDIVNAIYEKGIFDYSQFDQQVPDSTVRYIITRTPFQTLQFHKRHFSNYQKDTSFGPYLIYKIRDTVKTSAETPY